jgi:hypothetical protein
MCSSAQIDAKSDAKNGRDGGISGLGGGRRRTNLTPSAAAAPTVAAANCARETLAVT